MSSSLLRCFHDHKQRQKLIIIAIGRHVCPGRFLAVVQMKLLMAVILRHYDFKLQDGETERPHNVNFGPSNTPSHTAKLNFRQIRELPAPRVVPT